MKHREPHTVFIDLEILPDWNQIRWVWPQVGKWPNGLRASINSIICFGYKLPKKRVRCISAWDFPERWAGDVNDDYAVCAAAYEVLKDADVVVTQNGRKFDWPFLQTRLLHHGFPPLPRIIHVDTKDEAKNNLYLFSNSLRVMARFLTDDDKMDTEGWDLWVKVMDRDPHALKTMTKYCKHDVVVLEKVYEKLKRFVKKLPNANMFVKFEGPLVCPNCGSHDLIKRGRRVMKKRVLGRFSCQECGTWSQHAPKADYPEVIP